jgi:6-pyruvoyltetrahydropterin/6-carboxytetrahydropterin synthase
MHGHNWWVEAEVETTVLDGVGMGVDFREVKQALRAVTEVLDHRVLNEIPPFTEVNPTAENVAAYFAGHVARDLRERHPGRPIRVRAITLWETDHSAVRYEPDLPGDA